MATQWPKPAGVSVKAIDGFDLLSAPPAGEPDFGEAALGRHVLFLGAVGSGKTNGIMHLVRALRSAATDDDAFVFFDTKGDYRGQFCRDGDVVLESGGAVAWNVFADLVTDSGDRDLADLGDLGDQTHEIASTLFASAIDRAGQNAFFAYAARDVLAGVLLDMAANDQARPDNAALAEQLALPPEELTASGELGGAARYLRGSTAQSVLAYMQQTTGPAFAGTFGRPGDFSVRRFVRDRGAHALFVEYDLALGARLQPVYRVLIDLAIKEAIELGRRSLGATGRVFFVLDEFALLPSLSHLGDGINFGRELGLRFVAGAQNVHQVLAAYGPDAGRSILSGFGTVVAFRLLDSASRDLVRQRYGTNQKRIITRSVAEGGRPEVRIVTGNVLEDWDLAGLRTGSCVVAPHEGQPYRYTFPWPGQ